MLVGKEGGLCHLMDPGENPSSIIYELFDLGQSI